MAFIENHIDYWEQTFSFLFLMVEQHKTNRISHLFELMLMLNRDSAEYERKLNKKECLHRY